MEGSNMPAQEGKQQDDQEHDCWEGKGLGTATSLFWQYQTVNCLRVSHGSTVLVQGLVIRREGGIEGRSGISMSADHCCFGGVWI